MHTSTGPNWHTFTCPHCNKVTDVIPNRAMHNAESYRNSLLVKTLCCGKFVVVRPILTINLYKYEGDRNEDDWGETKD